MGCRACPQGRGHSTRHQGPATQTMRIGYHGGPDAGVLGATTDAPHQAVLVAGLAGIIADVLSMGSGGYLAAKSEQGV